MMAAAHSGLRADLLAGEGQLLGMFIIVPRVEVVEAAAAAGFDLVVLDCEHGPFGVESLSPLIAAARGAGLWVVVRVPANDEQAIGAVLDCGPDGVLVPHVNSGSDALRAVRASRFPPHGDRSVHPWVRAARYGEVNDYVSTADNSLAVLVMAEGRDAINNLDELTRTVGADAVFVGPMDLAASLGLAHAPFDPRVTEAAGDILLRTKEAGKAAAIFAVEADDARRWFTAGARLVVLSVDTALMREGFQRAVDAVRAPRLVANSRPGLDGDSSNFATS